MSVEILDEIALPYIHWALEEGVWDGRSISWLESSDFIEEMGRRIEHLLESQDPESFGFSMLAARFAAIGAEGEELSLIEEEIRDLGISLQGKVIQAGFGKSCGKFWEKHKVAILIGVGVVSVITGVVIVTLCTGGTAGGAALAGGAAALDKMNSLKKDKEPSEPKKVVCDEGQVAISQEIKEDPLFQKSGFLPSLKTEEVAKLREITATIFPEEKSWPKWALETMGREVQRDGFEGMRVPSLPHREPSQVFLTEGTRLLEYRIGGINGMNTLLQGAGAHAQYIRGFTPNLSVEWVYNHSNSPLVDLAEVFAMNYPGYSPNTANLLRENWKVFHEENKQNPKAKYLQLCHSQGAIHVRNALQGAPEELRDRVIVVAIAPGAIIPKRLCHKSFNYASKNDIVPKGELVIQGLYNIGEDCRPNMLLPYLEDREELILLDSHPDAQGMDHDFQSKTFQEIIEVHVEKYLLREGDIK